MTRSTLAVLVTLGWLLFGCAASTPESATPVNIEIRDQPLDAIVLRETDSGDRSIRPATLEPQWHPPAPAAQQGPAVVMIERPPVPYWRGYYGLSWGWQAGVGIGAGGCWGCSARYGAAPIIVNPQLQPHAARPYHNHGMRR